MTTRRELEQILTPFVTAASDEEFQWARRGQVSSPVACGTARDTGRDWARVNVLAIFDATGVLKCFRRCSERDLVDCLPFMAENVSIQASKPDAVRFSVSHQGAFVGSTKNDFFGEAVFDEAGLHIQQTVRGFQPLNQPVNFELSPMQIEKFAIKDTGSPEAVDIELRFKPGTKLVENLTTYGATARDTWRLVWYLRSANPLLLQPRSRK